MGFAAGQTYLFPINNNQTAHLWIIATSPNPDGLVLVVSLTSLNGSKDQTVILNGREHPFLKWPTTVAYALADLISCDALANHINCGLAKMHVDLDPKWTALVLDGFTSSPFTKKRIIGFVKQYKQSPTEPK